MEGAIIKTSNDFSRPDIIRNRLLVPLPKLLLYDKRLAQPEPIFAWSIYHMAICQDSECSCKRHPYNPTVKPIQPAEEHGPGPPAGAGIGPERIAFKATSKPIPVACLPFLLRYEESGGGPRVACLLFERWRDHKQRHAFVGEINCTSAVDAP